jgi:hypothetical protein
MNPWGTSAAARHQTFMEKAAAAWGAVPVWVEALATHADKVGLGGAEQTIGYSRSALSSVINAKYPGDLGRIEQIVRGALMSEKVDCPVLGEIGRDHCLIEQSEPFRATSALRAQLFHACRSGCPNARKTKGEK